MTEYNPDILCLQEMKAMQEQAEGLETPGYTQYWNSAERKGHFGTAIFSKIEPLQILRNYPEEIAKKYKILLSSGGTKDPMELYKNFRGSEPKVESLLKRAFV